MSSALVHANELPHFSETRVWEKMLQNLAFEMLYPAILALTPQNIDGFVRNPHVFGYSGNRLRLNGARQPSALAVNKSCLSGFGRGFHAARTFTVSSPKSLRFSRLVSEFVQ